MTRGEREYLELLRGLENGSMGCAIVGRKWLAARLQVPFRTLDRWTAKFKAAGILEVKQRQRHAAQYTVQPCQNGKADGKASGKAETRYIGRVKLSEGERRKLPQREERREARCLTAAEMWPEQPRRTG